MSNPAFIDGSVVIGSFSADIKRGTQASPTTIVVAAVFDNFTATTPANVIQKPNTIGGANGFSVVNTQEVASGTVQLLSATTETVKNGDWISFVRDGKGGATAEVWVLHNIGDPFENGPTYRKHTFSAHLAHNPP